MTPVEPGYELIHEPPHVSPDCLEAQPVLSASSLLPGIDGFNCILFCSLFPFNHFNVKVLLVFQQSLDVFKVGQPHLLLILPSPEFFLGQATRFWIGLIVAIVDAFFLVLIKFLPDTSSTSMAL